MNHLPQRGSTIAVRWTVEDKKGCLGQAPVDWKALVWDIHGDMLTLFYEAYQDHPAHISYIRCRSASELLDLDTQETLRWASSSEEASFSMAELEALTTQECDDYSAETCEQATQQWRRLTPDQRRLYARGVRGLPELAAEQ